MVKGTGKRVALTLEEKVAVVNWSKAGLTQEKIIGKCKTQFNKEPSRTGISGILKEKEKWLQAAEEAVNPNKARLTKGKWPTLEKALVGWFQQVTSCCSSRH
jgi:hypothetical protein